MKVGSFEQAQEPNRNAIHRKGLETSSFVEAGVDGNGRARQVCLLAGTCANGGRSSETLRGLEENPQYTCELSALDREVLDTPSIMAESSRREDSIPFVSQKRGCCDETCRDIEEQNWGAQGSRGCGAVWC